MKIDEVQIEIAKEMKQSTITLDIKNIFAVLFRIKMVGNGSIKVLLA